MLELKLLKDVQTFNYGVPNKFEAFKAKIMQPRLGFEFLFIMEMTYNSRMKCQLHAFAQNFPTCTNHNSLVFLSFEGDL